MSIKGIGLDVQNRVYTHASIHTQNLFLTINRGWYCYFYFQKTACTDFGVCYYCCATARSRSYNSGDWDNLRQEATDVTPGYTELS